MAQPKAQIKLNRELKRAVHSGDEYDDYQAIMQFLNKQRSILAFRLRRIEMAINDFYNAGGEMEKVDNVLNVSFGDLRYTVVYNSLEQVEEYHVKHPGNKNEVEYCHKIYYCSHMRPKFASTIKKLDEQLADLDNDNTLRGIFEIRNAIRGDRWLTMSAVSGVGIQREDDIDPYGVFGREDEE